MTMLVPMMSAGIRSGVNWIRLKSSDDGVGERPHQQRLAQARHAFQERVPADEQAGQDAVDDLVVADDDLGDLALDLLVGRCEIPRRGLPSIRRQRRPSARILSLKLVAGSNADQIEMRSQDTNRRRLLMAEGFSFPVPCPFSRSSQTRCLALSKRLV